MEGFGPAGDDLTDAEFGGFAAFDGAIEDGAIDQSAVVMDFNGIFFGWFWTGGGFDDFVLQTAGGGSDAIAFAIGGEEVSSGFGIFASGGGGGFFLFSLHFLLEFLQGGIGIGLVELGRGTGEGFFDAGHEGVHVHLDPIGFHP